jgi:hypothetical protein
VGIPNAFLQQLFISLNLLKFGMKSETFDGCIKLVLICGSKWF